MPKEETQDLEMGVETGKETSEEIDFSGVDLDAIATMSDEDIEKVLAEGDTSDGRKPEGEMPSGELGEGESHTPPEKPKLEEHSDTEKLRKQIADKEAFIQDRNKQIGDLRKQVTELLTILQQGNPVPPRGEDDEVDPVMKEEFFRDPVRTMEKLLAEKRRRTQLKNSVLQAGVREAIPDIEELKDDIAKLALEDGWSREAVDGFRTSLTGDVPLVKSYVARVKMAKELTDLRIERDKLLNQVKELPKRILQKIDAAAKKRTHLDGGGDLGGDSMVVSESQLSSLSDDDLNRVLKKMEREEK